MMLYYCYKEGCYHKHQKNSIFRNVALHWLTQVCIVNSKPCRAQQQSKKKSYHVTSPCEMLNIEHHLF